MAISGLSVANNRTNSLLPVFTEKGQAFSKAKAAKQYPKAWGEGPQCL